MPPFLTPQFPRSTILDHSFAPPPGSLDCTEVRTCALTSPLQNNTTAHLYPSITACVRRTFAEEGLKGFYRGLGTNLVRVLPGTCVTFVAYENIAYALKRLAARREES